jgi:hypothetical protein
VSCSRQRLLRALYEQWNRITYSYSSSSKRPALSCTAAIWCGWATADSILPAADIQVVVSESGEKAEAGEARERQTRALKGSFAALLENCLLRVFRLREARDRR